MARARQGNSVKKSLKVFTFGKAGSGKSGFGADFAKMTNEDGSPMKLLVIDLENGSIDGFHLDRLQDDGVDPRNIYIVYTNDYKEINDYCKKFINNEYFYELDEDGEEIEEDDKIVLDAEGKPFIPDAIVIDGITTIADDIKFSAIDLSEERASIRADLKDKTSKEKRVDTLTAGLEFKDYDKLKMKGKRLIRDLINNTDKHVVITARAKDEKKMKKNGNSMVLSETGREIPETWDFIQYEMYSVINQFEEDGEIYGKIIAKDRSGKFKRNDILDMPSITMWQSVIDSNRGKDRNVGNTMKSYDETLKENKKAVDGSENTETVTKKEDPKTLIKAIKEQTDEMSVVKKSKFQKGFKDLNIDPKKIKEETLTLEEAKSIQKLIDSL